MTGESNQAASPDSTTVKKILHNALEHFSKYGYAGASVREITHASHVTKPTLYYYFKNKEELYRKLAETCFEEILNVISQAAQSQGSSSERAIKLISEYCRLTEEKSSVIRFIHLMQVAPERTAPDVGVGQFITSVRALFDQIVVDGVTSSEITPDKREAVKFALCALCHMQITGKALNLPGTADQQTLELAVKTILA